MHHCISSAINMNIHRRRVQILSAFTIELDDDQDGGWVSVSSGTGSPGYSRTKGRKTVVVVVVVDYTEFQNKTLSLAG